ncbi:type VI secretion system Vgr family protein [Jannaschia pohangensis]|uniref:Type VI secretion system secreted protein VgrG n=1 Tax=Jannaschia pohangensis TaxID=390807 RepID=A0A1I3UL27_9RHOB|nr:type VI secretion system tip protein TssI/VgrG [Jannaschia pohangensis]SFJ83770.1 type VI secretion system secreted protein VgrG [Jannaschia pohangensis]
MNKQFRQGSRIGRLETALGQDALVLRRFTGEDKMNGLFEYRVEALATGIDIDFDSIVGTHATVELKTKNHGERFFDGIVTQVKWAGTDEQGNRYDLLLRPWFWLAGRRRNQRIFHTMSAPQILTELLSPYAGLGNPHLEMKLTQDYPILEYTVQYGESDMAFATRIMERFGISYHFVHASGVHTMVLTDDAESHDAIPGGSRVFVGVDGHHFADEEHFWALHPERNLTTGAIRLTDYNFKMPHAAMEVDRTGDAAYAQGEIESFDYPGDYLAQGEGRGTVRRRVDEERGHDRRFRAEGDCTALKAGMIVELTGEPAPGLTDPRMLCLVARHSYLSEGYGTSTDDADEYAYSGTYVLSPVSAPMVPDRKTPSPVMKGPQTATVVGEGEIDCDEYGRILVHFHWDLDKAISMRCRVSQNWASKGWGGMVIPRIGMEVVVEFLDGDPDKPLVTGCVYNGANDPPYPLPAAKTKSVFKTDTHQGSGFNELTFEDEKDRELIYMHGQKDQQIDILNDRNKTIGRDQSESVGRDKMISIGRDHTESIGQDARHTVARDVIYQVGQNQQERYGKDHVHVVGNIHKQDIYADHLVQTGRNREETVKGRYVLNVNQSITNNTKTHTLMAFDKFVIKGPGGKITIDASGITLEAAQIRLKGQVSMGGGGGAQVPTLQGAANAGLPLVEECVKQKGEE